MFVYIACAITENQKTVCLFGVLKELDGKYSEKRLVFHTWLISQQHPYLTPQKGSQRAIVNILLLNPSQKDKKIN